MSRLICILISLHVLVFPSTNLVITLFLIPSTLKEVVACENYHKLVRILSQMTAGLLKSMDYKGGGLLERHTSSFYLHLH